MKERSIAFSAPMACATLAGIKTQTRRALRVQPPAETKSFCTYHHPDPRVHHWAFDGASLLDFAVPCPYGEPGDLLWGREHYRLLPEFDGVPPREAPRGLVRYEADGGIESLGEDISLADFADIIGKGLGKFRPGMFMCRWMSRIELEVTRVRIERLQDITPADAIAEGLRAVTKDGHIFKYGIADSDGLPGTDDTGWPWHEWRQSPVDTYRRLWEKINGAGTWDTNPWVWAIDFKLVTP
ncbi:hypothetical protein LJR130_003836 [Variovorax sp. LjRoot130]|uniref:hypothetical protein n=1 Tax=Variovorax sp. LjRoot130 TaxID=3342261 RepID=UPI003ED07024